MADLERFWRKTPLGPLGVKILSSFTSQEANSFFLKILRR
jgi:hypothetical protein